MVFKKTYEENREKVNKELDVFLKKETQKTKIFREYNDLINSYVMSGGKRLRPLAATLSYNSYKKDRKIFLPSLALELLHTHTLILDDFMDEDDLRRGKPTIHKTLQKNFESRGSSSLFSDNNTRLSISFSVMLGNIVNILSRKVILESDIEPEKKLKAINLLDTTLRNIYHGQMLDLMMENKDKVTEEEYLNMIGLKTAELFGTSFKLGALIAEADENEQENFFNLGRLIGMNFQIQDDLLDLTDKKGHERGSDIRKGKNTLLMIKTKQKADTRQLKLINDLDENSSTNKIEHVVKIMHDIKAVDYCEKLSRKLNKQAHELVEGLRIKEHQKELITGFLKFIINQ